MKSLDEMTEPELKDAMNAVCRAIKDALPPNTGFIVFAAPFDNGVAQFASNIERSCSEEWMLETLLRWKRREFVER